MNKLLSAEFVRLFKSFVFRLCVLFSAGLGIFCVVMRWIDVKKHADLYAQLGAEYSNADGLLFVGGLYLIFAIAVFIGIFVGTEYSDGTIRNKLTVGHTRSDIYFSKLIVCAVADIILHILYIFVVWGLGQLLINGTTLSTKEIITFTAAGTVVMLAMTALLLLISMSIQSKAAGSVVCLLVTIIMLFATMFIDQRLSAPEYYDAYTYTDESTGEDIYVEKEKNTKYLTGTKRQVYEFLNDFLPISQLYQIVASDSIDFGVTVMYDCILIFITTGAGILIFKKKNLK